MRALPHMHVASAICSVVKASVVFSEWGEKRGSCCGGDAKRSYWTTAQSTRWRVLGEGSRERRARAAALTSRLRLGAVHEERLVRSSSQDAVIGGSPARMEERGDDDGWMNASWWSGLFLCSSLSSTRTRRSLLPPAEDYVMFAWLMNRNSREGLHTITVCALENHMQMMNMSLVLEIGAHDEENTMLKDWKPQLLVTSYQKMPVSDKRWSATGEVAGFSQIGRATLVGEDGMDGSRQECKPCRCRLPRDVEQRPCNSMLMYMYIHIFMSPYTAASRDMPTRLL